MRGIVMAVIVCSFFLCSVPLSFSRNATSGTMLMNRCNRFVDWSDHPGSVHPDVTQAIDIGGCLGFVEAAIDLETSQKVSPYACIPSETTPAQVTRVVSKYMKDNPQNLNSPALVLAHNALLKAYPCK